MLMFNVTDLPSLVSITSESNSFKNVRKVMLERIIFVILIYIDVNNLQYVNLPHAFCNIKKKRILSQ